MYFWAQWVHEEDAEDVINYYDYGAVFFNLKIQKVSFGKTF